MTSHKRKHHQPMNTSSSSSLPSSNPGVHALLVHRRVLCFVGLALGLLLAGCGQPELCQQEGKGSFSDFRQSTWAPYCADLEDRLQNPLNYEFILLTEFFSEYPDQQQRMQSKLTSFEEHDRCFTSQDDKLAYRRLNRCLSDDEVQSRIMRAWSVRAEPWLEDYDNRVDQLVRSLDAAERDAEYIYGKIEQQNRRHAPVDIDRIKEFRQSLDEMQRNVDAIDMAKSDYERLKGASMAYQDLSNHIDATLAAEIAAMFERHDKNRFAIAKLRNKERFFNFAVPAVGTPCPESPEPKKVRKEVRTAQKLVAARQKEVGAGKIVAVTTPVLSSTDAESGEVTESFDGHVCGKRNIDNQFSDYFELCSRYVFTIERTKPAGQKRFGEWTLASFDEGDPSEGVDCALLDGPLPDK